MKLIRSIEHAKFKIIGKCLKILKHVAGGRVLAFSRLEAQEPRRAADCSVPGPGPGQGETNGSPSV